MSHVRLGLELDIALPVDTATLNHLMLVMQPAHLQLLKGGALKAEKLMLVTGAPGILESLEDPRSLVSYTDLALAECVRDFEKCCAKLPASDDADIRQKANTLWLAAREYLRRHSIAEKASHHLTQHNAEKFGVLQFEYELEASAMLALRQATGAFGKIRPEAK